MKKSLLIIQIIAVCSFFATAAFASGGDRGHHKGHHKHRHAHYHENDGYAAQPQPRNYAPQPYQDPRSHQGLAGGVVGSVLGYEIGKGDPIATGLGAAAGSYIGNGISGRR